MAEENVFTYWLANNAMNYRWQLDRLSNLGINHTLNDKVVTFQSNKDTPLANFLNGKSFNVLTWDEVSVKVVEPKPPIVTTYAREEKPSNLKFTGRPKEIQNVTSPKLSNEPKEGNGSTATP